MSHVAEKVCCQFIFISKVFQSVLSIKPFIQANMTNANTANLSEINLSFWKKEKLFLSHYNKVNAGSSVKLI